MTAIIEKWRVCYKTRRSPYLMSNEGITEDHGMYRPSHLFNCPHLGPVFTIPETTHILMEERSRVDCGKMWGKRERVSREFAVTSPSLSLLPRWTGFYSEYAYLQNSPSLTCFLCGTQDLSPTYSSGLVMLHQTKSVFHCFLFFNLYPK